MCEICGVKFLKGTSKRTGKPYAGYILYYTEDGASQGVEGFVCGDCFCNASLFYDRKPHVGDHIRLSYDRRGFLTAVDFEV